MGKVRFGDLKEGYFTGPLIFSGLSN